MFRVKRNLKDMETMTFKSGISVLLVLGSCHSLKEDEETGVVEVDHLILSPSPGEGHEGDQEVDQEVALSKVKELAKNTEIMLPMTGATGVKVIGDEEITSGKKVTIKIRMVISLSSTEEEEASPAMGGGGAQKGLMEDVKVQYTYQNWHKLVRHTDLVTTSPTILETMSPTSVTKEIVEDLEGVIEDAAREE